MHFIGEIPHPSCKISLYQWNGKYLVKVEAGLLEQTYKISETEIGSEDDLRDLLAGSFMNKVMERFEHMARDWELALEDLED